MRINKQSTLADALAAWGAHEAAGRLRGQLSVIATDKMTSLNIVLHYRAPFVARILLREPIQVFEVEFDPTDADKIVLADTRTFAAWIDTTQVRGGDSLDYFQRVVASDTPPHGPFFAAATRLNSDGSEIGNLILYDGWHRLSAWYERIRQDKPSSIGGFLVVSRLDDPLMKSP